MDIFECVKGMLEYIGEDPCREGLRDTPKRVVQAWSELFRGYGANPADVFKSFDEECDELVLLKNCEIYSTCEHHMLPFFGKCHIAYIPLNEKVVGISKLARLVEIYSRRLQIQERLCKQVTASLMKYLKPIGAACIIEAQHFCITSRGVNKQNAIMVTSSLDGVFKQKDAEGIASRAELLKLIYG